ncbi:MAG: InlB B-repeat-containing protein [Treponema sp.]|jgi:uncharacterized repeat protein (TIGR02543 family)|nr:InlB B-repeat-containing protein [Treponema sp.]
MIARQFPSDSQSKIFPSFSQASYCFVTFDYNYERPPLILEIFPGKRIEQSINPERPGYIFGGWFLDADCTTSWNFSNTVGGDNFTLYAKWIALLNVSFAVNGGEGIPPSPLVVIPGSEILIPGDNGIERVGYEFGGWNTQADGNGANFASGSFFKPAADVVLYAKWKAIVYYITYYLNGGINDPPNPSTYTIEDDDIVLKKPTRGEDIFIAWYEDALFSRLPVEIIFTREARNISLHARFISKRSVFSVAEATDDRYDGEPKLYLNQNGANIKYEGGQPIMERGLENQAFISLFTRQGWCGNVFLPPENRVGSDYEETCEGSITLSKLADIENSAVRALSSKAFPQVSAEVQNPKSDNLSVEIIGRSGGVLSFSRVGILWRNQRERLDHSKNE